MDQKTLKTSLCCICCRASEVRFCAAEIKSGFMRAESLSPQSFSGEHLQKTFSLKSYVLYTWYWKFYFISCGNQGQCEYFFFNKFGMWQALEDSSSVSSKTLQGMPQKPRERQNHWNKNDFFFFLNIFLLLKDKSLFFLLLFNERHTAMSYISCLIYSIQINTTFTFRWFKPDSVYAFSPSL